jgi:hypothetical protein
MDDTLSGKRYLFAWAITDGALDNYPEERKREMIISITEIHERILKGGDHTPNETK